MYKPRFRVVFTNERIITPSGLGMIGGMLSKSDFVKRCNGRARHQTGTLCRYERANETSTSSSVEPQIIQAKRQNDV